MERTLDVAVIGAGVVGASIVRQLSRYDLKIALIEAAEDVAMGATRANSAIVHAGYDCPPGSLMGRLNVRGNELYSRWCEELDVPLKRVGSLVIAFDDDDERELSSLYERGLENGVPGMRLITGDEARAIEPTLSQEVRSALFASTAGITCPYQMCIACAENARDNGCEWLMNSPVTEMTDEGEFIKIVAGGHTIRTRFVVNAAGLFSDQIARMLGDHSFEISPRKGEYMMLDRTACEVKTVIFQTPSPLGKGVLVSPTVDGNVFAGPTATDQSDRLDSAITAEGIDELSRLSRRSVPSLNLRAVIRSFAGVRAQPSEKDFVIRISAANRRLIHAAGICSPGLTSAPAIAEEIEKLICESGLPLVEKKDYIATRRSIASFRHMTMAQRREAVAEDARYGHVICRCETVTEAEIVEAIRRGARSIDAVKRRTRAGMGRCQGGFCGGRVMEILARELNVSPDSLTKFGGKSYLLAQTDGEVAR